MEQLGLNEPVRPESGLSLSHFQVNFLDNILVEPSPLDGGGTSAQLLGYQRKAVELPAHSRWVIAQLLVHQRTAVGLPAHSCWVMSAQLLGHQRTAVWLRAHSCWVTSAQLLGHWCIAGNNLGSLQAISQ